MHAFEVPVPTADGCVTLTVQRSPDIYLEIPLESVGDGRDVGTVTPHGARRVRFALDDRPLAATTIWLIHQSERAGQREVGRFTTNSEGFAVVPGLVQGQRYFSLSGGPPLHVNGRVNLTVWDGSDSINWSSK